MAKRSLWKPCRTGKHERGAALKAARNALIEQLVDGKDEDEAANITGEAKNAWEKLLRKEMRTKVATEGIRIDGRQTHDIRPIWIETGVADRAHGSVVFTRGETQGFVTATLGVDRDAQRIDNPGASEERRWMLQYNFPPYCTGEVRRMGGPKRREVGHGALAHRALEPCFRQRKSFHMYCVVHQTSSSQMGLLRWPLYVVPHCLFKMLCTTEGPVAGIAMGLIKEGETQVLPIFLVMKTTSRHGLQGTGTRKGIRFPNGHQSSFS